MSTPALPSGLRERWDRIRARLGAAAARAGRPTPLLVAVTKSVSAEVAADLARLGQQDLAENRVQALESKLEHLRTHDLHPRWHLIGHLQRNKARRAALACHGLHSVDSPELLLTLERIRAETGAAPELYLEVDYVGDGTRTGLAESAVPDMVERAREHTHLRLAGLMTLAPLPDHEGDTRRAREVFVRLRHLAERLPQEAFVHGRPLLSMGMSSDFEVATEEGSDCVRVGSALFSPMESGR